MADPFEGLNEAVDMEHERANVKIPVATRVSIIERDLRGHSRSLSTIIETLRSLGKTVEDFEKWQLETMLDQVRREEQHKALLLRLDQMTESFTNNVKLVRGDLQSIKSTAIKLAWIVLTPVGGAVALAIFSVTFGGSPKG